MSKAFSTSWRKAIIATQFGFKNGNPAEGLDSCPETIRKVAEKLLEFLKTGHIDVLDRLRVDPSVPNEEEAGTVRGLIQEGKVRQFGLSEAGIETPRSAHAIQQLPPCKANIPYGGANRRTAFLMK